MTKWMCCILLALSLAGCTAKAPASPAETVPQPSPPAFSPQTTPQEQLQAAMDKTFSGDYALTFGTAWQGEDNLTSGDITALRALIPNENLVADFCKFPILAAPGSDDSLAYQVTELSLEEMYRLICGTDPTGALLPEGYTDALGTVTFQTDSQGRFTELRFDIDLDTGSGIQTWTLLVRVA